MKVDKKLLSNEWKSYRSPKMIIKKNCNSEKCKQLIKYTNRPMQIMRFKESCISEKWKQLISISFENPDSCLKKAAKYVQVGHMEMVTLCNKVLKVILRQLWEWTKIPVTKILRFPRWQRGEVPCRRNQPRRKVSIRNHSVLPP